MHNYFWFLHNMFAKDNIGFEYDNNTFYVSREIDRFPVETNINLNENILQLSTNFGSIGSFLLGNNIMFTEMLMFFHLLNSRLSSGQGDWIVDLNNFKVFFKTSCFLPIEIDYIRFCYSVSPVIYFHLNYVGFLYIDITAFLYGNFDTAKKELERLEKKLNNTMLEG